MGGTTVRVVSDRFARERKRGHRARRNHGDRKSPNGQPILGVVAWIPARAVKKLAPAPASEPAQRDCCRPKPLRRPMPARL
jgi:hypothetical protein